MLADPFWLSLVAKMAIVAAIVVSGSLIAERSGPFFAALVATLPISAGPAYVFLALEHDDAFIAAGAVSSLSANAATAAYALVYAALAQRHGVLASLAGAIGIWLVAAFLLRAAAPPLAVGILLNVLAYGLAIPPARGFVEAKMPPMPRRRPSDLVVRAGGVALLVGTVTTLSQRIGPAASGLLALFPIVMTSFVLVLHPRVGGRVAGAVVANGLLGLAGFGAALVALHLAAVPLGRASALTIALVISVGWNLFLFLRRYRAGRR